MLEFKLILEWRPETPTALAYFWLSALMDILFVAVILIVPSYLVLAVLSTNKPRDVVEFDLIFKVTLLAFASIEFALLESELDLM